MPGAQGHPNIILFFTDQQRWDTCGRYGQRLPATPHLDRLAAEGVRFEHAYTCQPVCGPARAVLQTGVVPVDQPVPHADDVPPWDLGGAPAELGRHVCRRLADDLDGVRERIQGPRECLPSPPWTGLPR